MLLGLANCRGIHSSAYARAFVIHRSKMIVHYGPKEKSVRVVELANGRFGLEEVRMLPGMDHTPLPGEYATEMEAEKAARKMVVKPEVPRPLHARNRELPPLRFCPHCFAVEHDGEIKHGAACKDADGGADD